MRILTFLILCTAFFHAQAKDTPLWFYYTTNLAVEKNLEPLENVFRKAAASGYSRVLLHDSKFGRIGKLPRAYTEHVERVKKLAEELKIEIVPAIFPIGYSESLLYHNPNLAEGLPVKEALYVVKEGKAILVPEPQIKLNGADFRNFDGWSMHDGKIILEDGTAKVTDPKGNARLMQEVTVNPFRQYHVSVEIKTSEFKGTPEIKILNEKGNPLNYDVLEVARTQDWKRYDIVFNSLENTSVRVYFGCWDGTTGTLWWRTPHLEETGLVNLIRRDGAPLTIQIEGNNTPLLEGKDYEKVSDPRTGTVPWSGSFEGWHTPPELISSLPDGTHLRVSYYHAITIHSQQVVICPSEPQTVELLREQAKNLHALFQAKGYFMSHDEIRTLNWCKACQDRHLDAGEILADNVKTCLKTLREVNPGGDIYVWSDMFDPHHNARNEYYLVRGDFKNSWLGLDKEVIIALWNYDTRNKSIEWFENLGNRMLIAGYYDTNPQNIREWISAARKSSKIVGIMYTTWENNFSDLERFAETAKQELGGLQKQN